MSKAEAATAAEEGAGASHPTEIRFSAFVSYSHRDTAAARALHERLERYRVPRRLPVARFRKTLRPVFLDRADYRGAGDYDEETARALRQCGSLVVVCTPDGARSEAVDGEVLEFKRLGRTARVLPFILRGEPNATAKGHPEDECFPPALRFALGDDGRLSGLPASPIAADARPHGDGPDAFLKIVAGILDVDFDKLKRRHVRAARWRAVRILGLSGMLLLAICGGLAAVATVEQRRNDLRAADAALEGGDPDRAGNLALRAIGPASALVGWTPNGLESVLRRAGAHATAAISGAGCRPDDPSPEQACVAGPIAVSPDGGTLATVVTGSVVRIVELPSGRISNEIISPGGAATQVAVSDGGRLVAVGGSDGTLQVWRRGDREPAAVERFEASLATLRFAGDHNVMVVVDGRRVVRLRVEAAALVEEKSLSLGETLTTEIDPTGRWVLARSSRRTLLVGPWSGSTAPDTHTVLARRTSAWSFSRDGRRLALVVNDGMGDRFYVIQPEVRTEPIPVRGHHGVMRAIGFSGDGTRLVTGGLGPEVRIWPVGKKAPSAILQGPLHVATWVSASTDGSLFAAFGDDDTGQPMLLAWRVSEPDRPLHLRGHAAPVRSAIFVDDGTLITASDDASIRVWNLGLAFGLLDQITDEPREALRSICSSPANPFGPAAVFAAGPCEVGRLGRLGWRTPR